LAQFLRSLVGAVLLDKIQRDAEQNDEADNEKIGNLAAKRRHRTGNE
jgi:hypothetical protein